MTRKCLIIIPLCTLPMVFLSACSRSSETSQAKTSLPSTAALSPEGKMPGPKVTIKTDVLVVGGTPTGVAAALAAGRRGAKVLLVEPRDALGGDIVFAMLNMFDVPMRPDGTSSAATGIFGEFFKPLGIGFDISKARALFEAKVAEQPNITVWKRTRVAEVWKTKSNGGIQVTGAVVESEPGAPNPDLPAPQVGVQAKVVIDATNDASFAARAGAKCFIGREAGGYDTKQQSVSLLFAIEGANWQAMETYVKGVKTMPAAKRIGQEYASDVAPTTSKEIAAPVIKATPHKTIAHRLGGIDGNYIWERGDVIEGYTPQNPNVIAMSINFGRQSDGSIVLNTLNAVGVDGLNLADKERARRELSAEITPFITYLRHAMPGLENIRLTKIAPELYIRETRHLRGLYELQVADIRSGRAFPDRVALASYPLDLHPYTKGQTNPFGPQRYRYTIPLRALVPRWTDGLYVSSRCLSATYAAAGSARVIPITMAAGEACGVAAALGAKNQWTPHEIALSPQRYQKVQAELRSGGADVGDQLPL
jgi:ribulose 1,5-bisphosphate synthetase/thiazole synthase